MQRNMKGNGDMRDTPQEECQLEQSSKMLEMASNSILVLHWFEARGGKKKDVN